MSIRDKLARIGTDVLKEENAKLQIRRAAGEISSRQLSNELILQVAFAKLLGVPEEVISREAPDSYLVLPHQQ